MSATRPQLLPAQSSLLGLDVEGFLRALLAGPARPSAGELLRAIERDVSPHARGHFEAALKTLVEDKALRRAHKAYVQAMLADGSVGAALHCEGKADEETVFHDRLDEPSQFGVLADCGHWWPGRFNVDNASAEIEAEAVAHIVTTRFGLCGSSAAYLSGYVADTMIPQGDSIDLIAKVAGRLERMAKGLLPAPKPRTPKPAKKT
jgi:hypothetical protein